MRAVDLFAGWGGFTCGAEQAGARVLWAANHWPLAVAAHSLNHPHAKHVCQDLRQADWTSLPAYELLLAAPACQGHSTASQPQRRRYHDALRATAWAVVDCAEVTRPAAIVVENVPSFLRWELFGVWFEALGRLGYDLTTQVLTASRWGVPQRRERLIVIGVRDGRAPAIADPNVGEPAFAPCVEWDAPGWRTVSRASVGARARIDSARRRLGRRFLVQHVTGHRGVSLAEPIRTITTKDQWIVVDGDRYRPLTLREYARAMGFPDTYRCPDNVTRSDAVKGYGNAICPPMARAAVSALLGTRCGDGRVEAA